jgi:nucleoid DNA-binding protein
MDKSGIKDISKLSKARFQEILGHRVYEQQSMEIVKAVFQSLADELKEGKIVKVKGFGKFCPVLRKGFSRISGIVKRQVTTKRKIMIKFYGATEFDLELQKLLKSLDEKEK